MTGSERYLQDRRPIGVLIETALAEAALDDQAFARSSGAICVLHARGTRDVLDAALALCQSLDPKCRASAAGILGELGQPERTFPEECCDALVKLMRHDPAEEVVIAAIFALGHLGNRRCDPDLIAMKDHPEQAIRYGVAFSLSGTESSAAAPALLALMEDPYVKTRDWATTVIGQTLSFNGPEIRDALLRRATTDDDEITRGEAVHGLARRGDQRVVPLLIAELSKELTHPYEFEDAARTYLGLDETQEVDAVTLIEALQAKRH